MERLVIDGQWEVALERNQRPLKAVLRCLQPEREVQIELPYVKEPNGIRPAKKGEVPSGFLEVEVEVNDGLFQIIVHAIPGNGLNMLREGSSCSMLIWPSETGTKVVAIDGVGDWRKEFVISRTPEDSLETRPAKSIFTHSRWE